MAYRNLLLASPTLLGERREPGEKPSTQYNKCVTSTVYEVIIPSNLLEDPPALPGEKREPGEKPCMQVL